jgi:hypothetical protein
VDRHGLWIAEIADRPKRIRAGIHELCWFACEDKVGMPVEVAIDGAPVSRRSAWWHGEVPTGAVIPSDDSSVLNSHEIPDYVRLCALIPAQRQAHEQ